MKKTVILVMFSLFLPSNVICVLAGNNSLLDYTIAIDIVLEDTNKQEYVFNLTNQDLLTIHLEIDRSAIDVKIDKPGGTIENNSWSGVSDTFDKKIGFKDDGKYTIEITNPGFLSGGDAIHVTGSYSITEGAASQAEIVIDFEPYDPLVILLGITMIIAVVVGIPGFFIYRRKKKRKKIVEKFNAPDYDIAKKIEATGYPNYELFQKGQQQGASFYTSYLLIEKYNVNNYELALDISRGKFPDYETYQQASREGIKHYDEWIERQQRKEALEKLMGRTQSIHRDDFMAVMGFETNHEFMDWFMNLPENSQIVLKGDKIEFEAAEGKVDDERVRELLISTAPAGTPKSYRLDELSKQQRSLIRDLQEGKALPHSQMVSIFNVSEFEVTFTIQSYLPGDTYLTRIADLYRLVTPTGTCQVCQQTTKDIPYFQCNSCYRYLCQEHYSVVKQIGYPVCPECEGNLVALPIQCKGCGITFLDLTHVKSVSSCQYCNYQLQTPDISRLKPSSLSTDQIKEISDLRNKIPYDDEKKGRD